MKYNSAAVTGSSGFIGKYLVRELKETGIKVFEVSRSTNSIDVTNWEQLNKIPAQEIIFHLAGITNIQEAFSNPRMVYFTNFTGTLNVLDWCRLHEIKKMVYISTFVYGAPQYLPVDEEHPVSPNNPYSHSKLMGEELCKAYSRDYGMDITILRLFNIYGPCHKGNFLIPRILEQLHSGKVMLGNPVPRRDFLYISDVISAIIAASFSELKGCNIFNIGSGKSYSVQVIANLIADKYLEMTGKNISIIYKKEQRKGEIEDTIADIEKAKGILKWSPEVDIETGINTTLRAYLNERQK